MAVRVKAFDIGAPEDAGGLVAALGRWPAARLRRLAIFAKAEGSTAADDPSRKRTRAAFEAAVLAHGGAALLERTTLLLSAGCEGIATPFGYVIADVPAPADRRRRARRLAVGCARSAPLGATDLDPDALIARVAETVGAALDDGGLARKDAALAIVKVPIAAGGARLEPRIGRGAAGLGVGLALGEIARARLKPGAVGRDLDVYAKRAMTFAGPELDGIEVIALGNRAGAGGDLVVASTLMKDFLDVAALRRLFAKADVAVGGLAQARGGAGLVALMLKLGLPPDGMLRGRRTTVFTGTLPMDSQIRAAASGLVGALCGDTRFYISADPMHHAPPGGGVAACIARCPR